MYNTISFDAQQHSSEEIGHALAENGCVLIRNALDRARALQAGKAIEENGKQLHEIVGKPVNDMPLCFADRDCPNPTAEASNDFSDPLTVSGMDRSWYYEGDRNYKPWFWEHGREFPNTIFQLLQQSILPDVYANCFQEDYICSYAQSVVRYQSAALKHQSYPFHQDGCYHSRDPKDHTGITTWIPLVDCGVDAPSLQLYPKAIDEILPMPPGEKEPNLFCDEELVMDRYGNKLWSPEMRAGDLMVFNAFVVHRTYITPEMNVQRQSVDIRVFPKSRLPTYVKSEPYWKVDLLNELR